MQGLSYHRYHIWLTNLYLWSRLLRWAPYLNNQMPTWLPHLCVSATSHIQHVLNVFTCPPSNIPCFFFQCSQLVSYKVRSVWVIPYHSSLFKFFPTSRLTSSAPLNPRLPSFPTHITGLDPCVLFDSLLISSPHGLVFLNFKSHHIITLLKIFHGSHVHWIKLKKLLS